MYSEKEREVLYMISSTISPACSLHVEVENGIAFQKEQSDLYTLEEVAKVLSLSIVTVRQYVRTGKMRAIKQWKNWMVTSNEIAKVKYERQRGVQLADGECMLALVVGDLFDEGSRIKEYVLCTARDLLEQIQVPTNQEVYQYLNRVFPKYEGAPTYVESVSSIPDFFRRTWEVSYTDTLAKEEEIGTLFSEYDDELIVEELRENVEELLKHEPAEALALIEEKFGETSDVRTVLHIYSLLLHELKLNKEESTCN